jgi:flagellar hook-basal body complex protein FliE
MNMTASTAANAYANAAKMFEDGSKATGMETKAQGPSFTNMLESAVQELSNTANNSDKSVTAMTAGKADIVDVVTAVAETELTVQALVSVRDRVITAYQEILRMPI